MNRNLKDSLISGSSRNGVGLGVGLPHRRGSKDTAADENMDLFSRNRRSLSVASSDESDLSAKLGRLTVGSAKPRNGLDDLLASTQGGKHDYDWYTPNFFFSSP